MGISLIIRCVEGVCLLLKASPKIGRLAYCAVNNFAPVVVPPAFVNEIFLELVPAGTVIRIKFALRTFKLATKPLTPTAVVPTKMGPLHHERSIGPQTRRIDDPEGPMLGCS